MKTLNEFLYWFHISLAPLGIVLAIALPVSVVILGLIGYKLHLKIFNGCIITNWQRKLSKVNRGHGFFDSLYFQLTGKYLTYKQLKIFRSFNLVVYLLIIAIKIIY